jgi:transcriptional regulator with XRE-family HTH domain
MGWVEKIEHIAPGMTPGQMERMAGWSPNTLRPKLVSGNPPSAHKAVALARALGVSADWLFDDDQPIDNPIPAPQMGGGDPVTETLLRLRNAIDGILADGSVDHPTGSRVAKTLAAQKQQTKSPRRRKTSGAG